MNSQLVEMKTEIDKLEEEKKNIEDSLKLTADTLSKKKRNYTEFEEEVQKKKSRLQAGIGTSSSQQSQLIPNCPVCLEPMAAPKQIFNCKNGHQICGTCKPRVKTCATCRKGEYIGRAIAMEQMVRKIMNIEN